MELLSDPTALKEIDRARQDLTIESDLSQAAWLAPRLAAGTFEVRMSAPEVFEAYCRIFFPFVLSSPDTGRNPVTEHVTWRELAVEPLRT